MRYVNFTVERAIKQLSQLVMNNDSADVLNESSQLESKLSCGVTRGGASQEDDDGLSLALGGTATAVGEDTDASGQMDGLVVDKGSYSVGFGASTFEAEAATHDGSTPFAAASSFATAGGADFVFSFDHLLTSTDGTDSASERSQSLVFAIDFDEWDFPGGPLELGFSSSAQGPGSFFPWSDTQQTQEIEGNTADFTADLESAGPNTLADVDFSVLTLEDTLSDVSALGVIGVA